MTEGKVRDMTLGRAGMGKCFLSMWALLAKCSIYKILAVLLVMVLAEGVVFSMTLGGFCVGIGGGYFGGHGDWRSVSGF